MYHVYPGFLTIVAGTYIERFGADPCLTLARQRFNKDSSCDLDSETCAGISVRSRTRMELQFVEAGPESLLLSCAGADAMTGAGVQMGESREGRFINFLTGFTSGSVKPHIPHWYDSHLSQKENIARGFEHVLRVLHGEISPLLQEVPFFTHSDGWQAGPVSVRADLDYIESLNPKEDENKFKEIGEAWRKDSRWTEFERRVIFWLPEAEASRFDEGEFLKRLSPFIGLYMYIRKTVFDRKMRNELFSREIVVELIKKFGPGGLEKVGKDNLIGQQDQDKKLPILYRKVARGVRFETAEKLSVNLVPRASLVFSKIKSGAAASIPEDAQGDQRLLGTLQGIVSQVLLYNSQGLAENDQVRGLLCLKMLEISTFISGVWRSITDHRRHDRLIFSYVKFCVQGKQLPASIAARQEIFKNLWMRHLLLKLPKDEEEVQLVIDLPSEKTQLVKLSRNILENKFSMLIRDVIIHFTDTPAAGNVGPRNQWLSMMFEEYFQPGNGLFECSDDDSCSFLKPVASGSSFSPYAMAAAGRLIALGIRYGLTIGARLAPCGVYALYSPREEVVDLESCVKAEDAAFLRNLNKLDLSLSWEDQEAARNYLADYDTTPEDLPEFKKKKLFEKGIGSIKEALFYIKKGMNDITKHGSMQLFTREEFELMVNGISELSAETLWSGISLKNLPPGSPLTEWLRRILETQDEKFRFAFNRFVTGVPQPPVKPKEPWINVRLETSNNPTSLPTAETCFSNLVIPAYPDFETFSRKLVQAVSEANESLELV